MQSSSGGNRPDERNGNVKPHSVGSQSTFSNRFATISLFILAFVFLTSLILGSTLSRYVTDENAPFGDDEKIDYSVNSVFVVKTQDELFEAINQGYTYVQLDKDIENPLIVTQKAETLDSDLILDLNGIEIQRNGYDPILNIKNGVRLMVVDTSSEQTGGLYNPVGSVFNIVGGTLTIVTGCFESGPRYSEYYSYNNGVLNSDDNSLTKRTIVERDAQQVNYYYKDASGTVFVHDTNVGTAPIVRSYPTKTGAIEYNHGNLYFDEQVTKGNVTINPDTYCYYRTSEDSASGATDLSMADWYYTYVVNAADYSYVGKDIPTGANASDYVEVIIYGYENVIKQASEKTTATDYHAAIQMASGVLDVQSGSFFQYFGVSTTACVNSQGGEINVKQGNFSVRVPDASHYTANQVTVKEDDEAAFGNSYFPNFKWCSASGYEDVNGTYVGSRAKSGESYCILNVGDAKVTIGTGKAYASNNNIISMKKGNLTVSGGEYTKKMVNYGGSASLEDNPKLSAISMDDGNLNVSNSTCHVDGNGTAGILINDGTLGVDKSNFTVSGSGIKGIYSAINSNDGFRVSSTSFTINGQNAVGIYSKKGRVNLSASGEANISVTGNNSYGIIVTEGGSVVSSNYNYQIVGAQSLGIRAEVSAKGIKVSNGTMTVMGNESFGIQSYFQTSNLATAADDVEGRFTVSNFSISMPQNGTQSYSNQTGIYSQNGTIRLVSSTNSLISVHGDSSKGIHVGSGGSVESDGYSYSLYGDNSYGLFSEAGTISLSGGQVKLTSNKTCYGVYAESVTEVLTIHLQSVTIDVGYVGGTASPKSGSVAASAGIFLSSANDGSTISLNGTTVKCFEVGIVSNGGSVTMSGTGSVTTNMASSVAIHGGSVLFQEDSDYTLTSQNTTTNGSSNVYNVTLPIRQGESMTTSVYSNTDGIYVNGGYFTSYGKLTVVHTGLKNSTNDPNGNTYNYNSLVVTSYAVRVLGGDVTIESATVTAKSGGGIYAGKTTVSGVEQKGNVVLGKQNSANDIVVETTGAETGAVFASLGVKDMGPGWESKKSITGGHAIELNGGNITVYGGKYMAQFGNGVYANGDGAITLHDGEFYGFMNEQTSTGGYSPLPGKSGPAAYYGVKVVGGATVNIMGGKYDGGNGGAFVTGVSEIDASSTSPTIEITKTAKVYVYAGEFGNTSSQDGFNVYDDVIIVFGAGDGNHFGTFASEQAKATYYRNSIIVHASNASIAANPLTQNKSSTRKSEIYVYYGTYNGKLTYLDAACNSSTFYKVYNTSRGTGTATSSAPYYTSITGASGLQNNTDTVFFNGSV